MDFRILGPLEVLDEGHAITLGGRRQRALLALLLLHANETLSTDRLIDELWGERPPTNAAKTVQMQISRLRKALGWEAGKGSAGLVVTRGSGYQLRLDPERLDAHRFQRLAAEGRGELARGHPERAVLALERALALWRGAPLQELAYEPFAQREVARLDDLQVAALEQLVEAKLALGRHGEVVGELETLTGDHPYRERLRAQLMLALYRCDRQAEALQAYQDARRKLVEELGIEPGERLRELERAILAQDPGLATPEPPVAVAPRERSEPLLEREGPLAAIEEMIESATRSEGSVVAVEAAAGLGKSALLALAGDRAAARGLRVACARGADLERDFPFGIVRQLLEPVVAREAAREGRDPFDGAAGLASPLFRAPQEPVSSERPGTGSLESPGVAMHGLYWLAANLAERGPMLLCVDDLHWGDTASLRWLHYLARRLEGPPFALLVASRPGEAGSDTEVLAAIAAEPITRLVRLEPLSEQASGLFARRALGVPADERFCAACHAVSGGNPFLLGELTGTLAREGVEPTEASVSLVREFVPESVTRALALRLGRLPEAAGALARAVAILGSGPTLHDAAGLAELQEREAARAAAALAAVAILAPGLPLEFVHPLVRTAVYGELPEGERALWHARAGRLLAKGGAPSDRIAAHLLRAEPAGDAWVAERLRAAATDALSRADPHSAIAYLRRAFVEPVPRPERTALVHELVRASFLAMDPTATDGLGLDPLAELAADPDTLQASAVYLAIALWGTGRAQEALTVLDRALSAAMAAGDHDGALRIEVRRIALAQLPPSEALRRLEVFEGQVAPHGFAGRVVDAGLAWYGSLTGSSASETVERCRRAFIGDRLIRELQHDELVLTTFVLALLRTDELDLCERVIERMLAQGRACGSASAVASGSYLSAYLAHLRGDLLRAEADARAAVAAFEVTGIIARVPTQTALLVDVLVDRGEITEAAQEISAADMDGEIPDHWWFGPVVWSRGYLRLAQGKNREGVEELLEFGRRYHRDGLVPTVTRPWASHAAPLLAQQGEHDEARQLAQSELDEAQVWGTPRVIGQAQRGLALVIGGSEGIELLHEAVRTLESSPARLEHARALIDLGAALRRRNRRRDAREPLRCGLELAHRCGVRLLAARAAEELRATGAKPRRLVVTGVDALTPSERRIAEMTAEGLTNREIAQALFVTVKTVETHMGHIFRKLDVHARGQLAPLLHDSVNQPSKPSLALRSR